jgi:[FeFe] hydrogenase (group B1/B3)
MRGLDTPISKLRKQIFVEVAKVAYESDHIHSDIEAIPYVVTPGDAPRFRESVYRERAIASERVRLAMGMSLRPEDKPVHITDGVEESNILEKYYEPPLMQVIPSACNFCDDNKFVVSNQCQGCIAHPCMEVCPKEAVHRVDGVAVIDEKECIRCGKCKEVCPYDAIVKRERPCAKACGVAAIETDKNGRATINEEKCVSCGMCMVNCPFGAIADKSQLFQLIRCMKSGEEVIAEIAPAFAGQFGSDAIPENVATALLRLGFSQVYEVALGADIGAVSEAHQYVHHVVNGDVPFLLTSCCPSWSMLAKNQFPDLVDSVSAELTPMVATARSIKKKHPDAKVVFIGPCAAKKLEAMRTRVRSDVDFVITFEELNAMFEAKEIDPRTTPRESGVHNATGVGRGYAVAGGVAAGITKCIQEYYPQTEVKTEHVEGLSECKKILLLAKAGKKNGYLIEGMGCPGGCVAGAGTIIPIQKAKVEVKKCVDYSTRAIPPKELQNIELD